MQHFVLDEMQDYTPIQYAVLAKVFDCKRTIIGDFSQALLPYETISKQAFQAILPNLDYVELTTTYRSSYEIAMYAKKFMRAGDVRPIARHGKAPVEFLYETLPELIGYVQAEAQNPFKTTAIICKNDADLQRIAAHLMNTPYHIIDGETVVFETGVLLTTIQYAKGLEFDKVILPFVNADNYATEFDRGLLYIATTRAMHELVVLIDKQSPSPLV